ncbi:MAG: carbon monoxide dehydrogenase subunit G [Ancalomicrobiaceae bacterium]|nr:carbon monoxide dehydrogenase subunit G [Ancalomicrobiaceae bacterium]
MQMTDTRRISASRDVVWAALNDAEVLKLCIPGCDSLEMTSPTEMTAKVTLKIGPVKATFGGKVTLSDIDAPNGYRISGEGSGGVAGFARGGAVVHLSEDGPAATLLTYEVDAQIGGKLAQLGARLIDSTARKLAGEFFETFSAEVSFDDPETESASEPTTEVAAMTSAADVEVSSADVAATATAKSGWLKRMFGAKTLLLVGAFGISYAALSVCCLDGTHTHDALAGMAICAAAIS